MALWSGEMMFMKDEFRRKLNTTGGESSDDCCFFVCSFFPLFGYAVLVDFLHFAPPRFSSRTVTHFNQATVPEDREYFSLQQAASRKPVTFRAKPYFPIEFTLVVYWRVDIFVFRFTPLLFSLIPDVFLVPLLIPSDHHAINYSVRFHWRAINLVPMSRLFQDVSAELEPSSCQQTSGSGNSNSDAAVVPSEMREKIDHWMASAQIPDDPLISDPLLSSPSARHRFATIGALGRRI